MLKFILMFAFLSSAFAGTAKIEANPLMTVDQGVELLKSKFESEKKRFIFSNGFKANYLNGDFVILWGVGATTANQQITETEYKGL